MNFKLSPSALSLGNDCKRCFWLTQHKVWQRPEGIFPSLPNGMDLILKKHFDKFRDRNQLPPELKNSECSGDCKLFQDKELLEIWRNNKKGIVFQDEYGNILKGAIDNLLVRGDKLIVLDYKTKGFPVKENTHEYYKDQMNIYNYLLRKNNYKTEDYSFLLFYVPDQVLETGEILFDTKLVKVPVDLESAEKLWKDALKLLDGPCPQETCIWCQGVK